MREHIHIMVMQVISVVGALMVLVAYGLIQAGTWRELDAGYLALNILGSLLLGIVAIEDRRVGFVLLEFAWAGQVQPETPRPEAPPAPPVAGAVPSAPQPAAAEAAKPVEPVAGVKPAPQPVPEPKPVPEPPKAPTAQATAPEDMSLLLGGAGILGLLLCWGGYKAYQRRNAGGAPTTTPALSEFGDGSNSVFGSSGGQSVNTGSASAIQTDFSQSAMTAIDADEGVDPVAEADVYMAYGRDLGGIGWVLGGGESGPDARPMREAWALSVRDRCRAAGVAFLFKQWGAWGPDGVRRDQKANGRVLAGRVWDERPELGGMLL